MAVNCQEGCSLAAHVAFHIITIFIYYDNVPLINLPPLSSLQINVMLESWPTPGAHVPVHPGALFGRIDESISVYFFILGRSTYHVA